jgi:hypothetical protein
MGAGSGGFDMGKYFEARRSIRVTTFTDVAMFQEKLNDKFGERKWEKEVLEKMRYLVHRDLVANHKWTYQT